MLIQFLGILLHKPPPHTVFLLGGLWRPLLTSLPHQLFFLPVNFAHTFSFCWQNQQTRSWKFSIVLNILDKHSEDYTVFAHACSLSENSSCKTNNSNDCETLYNYLRKFPLIFSPPFSPLFSINVPLVLQHFFTPLHKICTSFQLVP